MGVCKSNTYEIANFLPIKYLGHFMFLNQTIFRLIRNSLATRLTKVSYQDSRFDCLAKFLKLVPLKYLLLPDDLAKYAKGNNISYVKLGDDCSSIEDLIFVPELIISYKPIVQCQIELVNTLDFSYSEEPSWKKPFITFVKHLKVNQLSIQLIPQVVKRLDFVKTIHFYYTKNTSVDFIRDNMFRKHYIRHFSSTKITEFNYSEHLYKFSKLKGLNLEGLDEVAEKENSITLDFPSLVDLTLKRTIDTVNSINLRSIELNELPICEIHLNLIENQIHLFKLILVSVLIDKINFHKDLRSLSIISPQILSEKEFIVRIEAVKYILNLRSLVLNHFSPNCSSLVDSIDSFSKLKF